MGSDVGLDVGSDVGSEDCSEVGSDVGSDVRLDFGSDVGGGKSAKSPSLPCQLSKFLTQKFQILKPMVMVIGHGHSFQKINSLINLNNISCALEDREKLDLIFCDGVEEESCIIVSELLNRK